eukprot:CAMPEP_0206245218 /NCGR_PEP_ID=MMETSP0047_2-20121206/18577_1 /ASSEMBLY_ACC=CAM_ASM_000192 /TAXON_ID=195065 /ORGANISM="Chroomonas mesostigmatica_cf, Strain CCMP1168" /LENGTH=163 /DNA_ID=CAMNT_0053670497 /DNA_START=502 /DNA_END=990 /DNA_ORIENTATION=+
MLLLEKANEYTVIDSTSGRPIVYVKEESEYWANCCCAPVHSLLLRFNSIDGNNEPTANTLMTMEREGSTPSMATRCVGACFDCSRDSMKLHQGNVHGKPGSIPETQPILGKAIVPFGGGGFTPTLDVFEGQSKQKLAVMKSVSDMPCLFGGFIELCFDSPWTV